MLRIRNNLRIFSPLGQLPLPPPPPPSEREDLSYFISLLLFFFYFKTQLTPIASTSLGSVSTLLPVPSFMSSESSHWPSIDQKQITFFGL